MIRKSLRFLVANSPASGKIVVPISVVSRPAQKGGFEHLSKAIGSEASEEFEQRRHLDAFARDVKSQFSTVYKDSKPHVRKAQKQIEEFGVEGAVQEYGNPSTPTFSSDLRQRPLDRRILEDIYKDVHGFRVEQRLKKGLKWEHWVAKGADTAPVYKADSSAQRIFGFGGHVNHVVNAAHQHRFPVSKIPEIAFIGRTNSGRSSLINALINASIAPFGHLQGTTTSANFYSIADKMMLVDLPGVGYYHPLQTTDEDARNAMRVCNAYLHACSKERKERNIKRIIVCCSSRGAQHLDVALWEKLERLGIPFSVILTKTDLAPIRYLARVTDYTRCQLVHYSECKEVMLSSSLRLSGIHRIQNMISALLRDKGKGDEAVIGMDFDKIV